MVTAGWVSPWVAYEFHSLCLGLATTELSCGVTKRA
jgi:hypothetical protein